MTLNSNLEPGYYKDNEYGIRIENIVRIAASDHPDFLEIETVSFVPLQLKLINRTLLTEEEVTLSYIKHKY